MNDEKKKTYKEVIVEKLLKKPNEVYKCAVCGEQIFRVDILGLNFEYIESKMGNRLIHSKCEKRRE